ncbi:hypothetical protein ACVCNR_00680 [Aquamicrobium terrae]
MEELILSRDTFLPLDPTAAQQCQPPDANPIQVTAGMAGAKGTECVIQAAKKRPAHYSAASSFSEATHAERRSLSASINARIFASVSGHTLAGCPFFLTFRS